MSRSGTLSALLFWTVIVLTGSHAQAAGRIFAHRYAQVWQLFFGESDEHHERANAAFWKTERTPQKPRLATVSYMLNAHLFFKCLSLTGDVEPSPA